MPCHAVFAARKCTFPKIDLKTIESACDSSRIILKRYYETYEFLVGYLFFTVYYFFFYFDHPANVPGKCKWAACFFVFFYVSRVRDSYFRDFPQCVHKFLSIGNIYFLDPRFVSTTNADKKAREKITERGRKNR